MSNYKQDLLEQKLIVYGKEMRQMQKELSEVLHEMQTTIAAVVQTNRVALAVIQQRLEILEEKYASSVPSEQERLETGKEL